MSQRNVTKLEKPAVRRTLRRFWEVTRMKPGAAVLAVFTSVAYIALLVFVNTWVMGLIVDRVQAAPVAADDVWTVFGPYILALLAVNLIGQACSKLQDYAVYKLQINGNYHLARLCFDTLSNQSMTFHTSRFGGALVSQTSKFMSGYTQMVDVVVYSLIPTIASTACTFIALAPAVPAYAAALAVMLVVYVIVATRMYQRILPLPRKRQKRKTASPACCQTPSQTSWPSRPADEKTLKRTSSTKRTLTPCAPRAARCEPPCSAASPPAASSP